MNKTKEISHFSPRQCRKLAEDFAFKAKTGDKTLSMLGINGFSRDKIAAMIGRNPAMDALTPATITQARLTEILRQSRLETFSQREWAEWLELVP